MNWPNKLECFITVGCIFLNDKHSNLSEPFVSYAKNEVLWIRTQEYIDFQLDGFAWLGNITHKTLWIFFLNVKESLVVHNFKNALAYHTKV
jgi:hypothetical protein